jgi:L-threonylcarbamoyladenylate synthase
LGANALDPKAVARIFEAKGRPSDNPLIAHIGKREDVYRLAEDISKDAERLMDNFWPGPLTIILKKSEIVPKITTGGLDTVAIRMPANRITLALIKEAQMPIAAPSANSFGKPSPTSAQHVFKDLDNKVDIIIDGGETEIGIESTVLDLTSTTPTLLRPGGVTLESLKGVLKTVAQYQIIDDEKQKKTIARSPGMKYKHYSPDAEVIVVEGEYQKVKGRIQELANKYIKEGRAVGVMTLDKNHDYKADMVSFVGDNSNDVAKNLFKTLRGFDDKGIDLIITEGTSDDGMGLAVMNRLRKAASKTIKVS